MKNPMIPEFDVIILNSHEKFDEPFHKHDYQEKSRLGNCKGSRNLDVLLQPSRLLLSDQKYRD